MHVYRQMWTETVLVLSINDLIILFNILLLVVLTYNHHKIVMLFEMLTTQSVSYLILLR